ncbi:MAG: hypothetical protein IT537_13140 [Hyphomicrobiales bacterium]|nr:hypothetical protein [Hyphomicrobiales bacterium]
MNESEDEGVLMRQALIEELGRAVSDGEGNLVLQRELLARALVNLGVHQHNIAALRELLDRIMGRVPAAAKPPEPPRHVRVHWMGYGGPNSDDTAPPASSP